MSPARKAVARRMGPGGWACHCCGPQSRHRATRRRDKQRYRQLERRYQDREARVLVAEGTGAW